MDIPLLVTSAEGLRILRQGGQEQPSPGGSSNILSEPAVPPEPRRIHRKGGLSDQRQFSETDIPLQGDHDQTQEGQVPGGGLRQWGA